MGPSLSQNQQGLSTSLQEQYFFQSNQSLIHKSTQKPCTLHIIATSSKEQSSAVLRTISLYGESTCSSISKLREHYQLNGNSYCAEQEKFYLIFDGCSSPNAKEEYLSRRYSGRGFEPNEIEAVLSCMLCGLRQYSKVFYRRDFRLGLENACIDPSSNNKLWLKDPWLIQKSTDSAESPVNFLANYPSPEKVQASNQTNFDYDEFKSELFTIGVLGLQLHAMNFRDDIYVHKKFVDRKRLNDSLNSIKNGRLRGGMGILLNEDPSSRVQIYQYWDVRCEKAYHITAQRREALQVVSPRPNVAPHTQSPQLQTIVSQNVPFNPRSPIPQVRRLSPRAQSVPKNSYAINYGSTATVKNNATLPPYNPTVPVQSSKPLLSPSPNTFNRPFETKGNPNQAPSIPTQMNYQQNTEPPYLKKSYQTPKFNYQSHSQQPIHSSKQMQNSFPHPQVVNSFNISAFNSSSIYSVQQSNPINNYHRNQDYFHSPRNATQQNLFNNQSLPLTKSIISSPEVIPVYEPHISFNKQPTEQSAFEKHYAPYEIRNEMRNEIKQSEGKHEAQSNISKQSLKNFSSFALTKEADDQYCFANPHAQKQSFISSLNIMEDKTDYFQHNAREVESEQSPTSPSTLHVTPQQPFRSKKFHSTIVEVNEDTPNENQSIEEEDGAINNIEFVVEEYETGSRYEGFKKKGLRNGRGKFFYQDGGYYDGEWKNNQMHGWGRLYYEGGKLAYEGNWACDEFHGYGKVYNDNPMPLESGFDYTNFDLLDDYWQYYEGMLANDTKEGRGRILLTNSEVFEGDFHADRIQGFGKFFKIDKSYIEGIWKDSRLIKIIHH